MAQVSNGSERMVKCSCKKFTMLICTVNLFIVLYVLHSLLGPRYLSSPSPALARVNKKYSEAELRRIREANEARKAAIPHELIKRVKEIQEEYNSEAAKVKEVGAERQRAADALAQRLKELKEVNNQINSNALEEWRKKKLQSRKRVGH